MTYFVWTTRLAMIVEDIVDLDVTPPPCVEPWDQHFVAALNARHDTIRRAEVIAQQLDDWRANMPPQIDVDHGSISPLPHHVIGLAVSALLPSIIAAANEPFSGGTLPKSCSTRDSSSAILVPPTRQNCRPMLTRRAQRQAKRWWIYWLSWTGTSCWAR